VAECNLVYLQLNRLFGLPEADVRLWRADVPWSAIYLEHIGTAAHQGYSMDGLQFTLSSDSRQLTYITGFRGVLAQGNLVRVWCVARDISELIELNERLRQKQDRLQLYARQLVGAEERARRATAVDLHDGIGQVLAGQSMTLAAMRMHASHSPLSVLLDEATEASREAQEGLRVMIQDLTPPGLDRASLDETLRWLADYFKTRYGFSVEWRVNGSADFSRDRLRLIYRCVRELLMNARKHSQRHSAEVEVDVSPIMVEITVVDEGIGFDARQPSPPSGDRFGLAQIRERVRAAGGTIDVDAVVGEGCRVIVRLPSPTPMHG